MALGFPAANLHWLAWVALVPWFMLVAAASGLRDAVWRSWAAGTGFSLAAYHWVLGTLGPFAMVPGPAMGAMWIPFGVILYLAFRRLRDDPRRYSALLVQLVVPSAWTLTEFVRNWPVIGGSWSQIGLTQWQVQSVRQLAALGGVWALSWLVVAVNTAVALVLSGRPSRTRLPAVLVPLALVVVVVGWGANRSLPASGDVLVIAGVQPGVVDDPEQRLAANEELTDDLDPEAAGIDFIVWGQSSVGFDPEVDGGVRERLEAVTDRAGVPVLVNVDARRESGAISKSSVLFEPGSGATASYVKQRLVPFGEYIPLRPLLGWVDRFTDAAAEDRVPGGDLEVLDVGGVAVGALISYEGTFPDLRRSLARLDPDVILVQGASTTFQGSWAQPQQAAGEAIRAVESGRSTALVAVSGTSSAFDPQGRRLAWLPSNATGVMLAELPIDPVETPYVRWGDWVVAASAVVFVIWASTRLWYFWTRQRGGRASAIPP